MVQHLGTKLMASKNRLSVNLSDSEFRELMALAEQSRVSMAWLGRQAIAEFLERHKDAELQLPLALTNTAHKRKKA